MDSAHAHPIPFQNTPSQTRGFQDGHILPATSPPPNRQQRLLRNRNAKFPAKKLSISGISARFTHLIRANEEIPSQQAAAPRNQENVSHAKPKSQKLTPRSKPSLGILEEISNTIASNSMGKRTRSVPKRQIITIFQDTPERALLEESPVTSPASQQDASSTGNSPLQFNHIRDSLNDMGLREISGNARKVSSFESPAFGGSVRAGRRRKSTQKSRFNSEEYIEHIEKELELVKDAVYSPNTNLPWKEKLKVAKAENERLRKEVADTRAGFEAEVQMTVEHMTATEVELRRKIRSLEDELESKEDAIQELELQHEEKRLDQSTLDTLRTTIERLEQEKLDLEETNSSISKRNEVLTQLLALSPTKSQQRFDLSTPVRGPRSPRPRSLMIPRMPSSPMASVRSRPHSLVASPASATGYFRASHTRANVLSTGDQHTDQSVNSATEAKPTPLDLEMDFGSSPCNSHMSESPALWDRRQSISSMVQQPARQPSKRRTRKFLRGSTQLKPLLLPTLTADSGALSPPTPLSSPTKPERRDISDGSFDPTTMFLSRQSVHSDLHIDRDHASVQDSPTSFSLSARDLAYQSLEGALKDPSPPMLNKSGTLMGDPAIPFERPKNWSTQKRPQAMLNTRPSSLSESDFAYKDTATAWMSSPVPLSPAEDPDKTILPSTYSQEPVNLQQDVEEADNQNNDVVLHSSPSRSSPVEVPEPLFSPASRRVALDDIDSPSVRRMVTRVQTKSPVCSAPAEASRKRRRARSSLNQSRDHATFSLSVGVREDREAASMVAPQPRSDSPVDRAPEPQSLRSSRASSLCLRSPRQSRGPLDMLQGGLGARPLASVTIKTIYGTLSRYRTYVRDIRRDPLALARRVLANAWHTNWALMGKLSWWVLGLFLGPSRRDYECASWDWDDYDAESIAERHCRRCSREITTEQLKDDAARLRSTERQRHVRFDEPQVSSYSTKGSKPPSKTGVKKSSWSQCLLLWGKFSVAIMLAVGGAVVKGPAEMLREADIRAASSQSGEYRRASCSSQGSDDSDASATCFDAREGASRVRQRRPKRQSTVSPPPSARTLLSQASPSTSAEVGFASAFSSAFQFGQQGKSSFDFVQHDWYQDSGGRYTELKTLELERLGGMGTDKISSFSINAVATPKVYDPESAGQAAFRSSADDLSLLKVYE